MRSEYVYLIFHQDYSLLSVHTVKREAHMWFDRSDFDTGEVDIYRMCDGGKHGKVEELVRIPWDEFKA